MSVADSFLRQTLLVIFVTICFCSYAQNLYWIGADVVNWSEGTNWSLTSGGPPCNCTPGTTSIVTFDSGSGYCQLSANANVQGIFIFDTFHGEIYLNGYTLTVNGGGLLHDASIHSGDQNGSNIGGTGNNLVFSGTLSTTLVVLGSSIFVRNFQTAFSTQDIDVTIRNSTISATNQILINSSGGNSTIRIDGGTFSAGYIAAVSGQSIRLQSTNTNSNNGCSVLIEGNAAFHGHTILVENSNVYVNGASFHGTSTTIRKKVGGLGSNVSEGGNTFESTTTVIENSSGSSLVFTNNRPDVFLGHAVLSIANGTLSPSLRLGDGNTVSFAGDVTFTSNNSNAAIRLGDGNSQNSKVIFDGSQDQSIVTLTYMDVPIFGRLEVNKSGGQVSIYDHPSSITRVTITRSLHLESGIINASYSANRMSLSNNAAVSRADIPTSNYVTGRIYKRGNQAFTFPVGGNGFYRPITISAPATTASEFYAAYIQGDPGNITLVEPMLQRVSAVEYWELRPSSTNENIFVTLSWDENSIAAVDDEEYINELADLTVAYWNGSVWANLGNGFVSGNAQQGFIRAADPASDFSGVKFTLASTTDANPLPVSLAAFIATFTEGKVQLMWETTSEVNNDEFIIERSPDAIHFKPFATAKGKDRSTSKTVYHIVDYQPLPGRNYYKLTQRNLDGTVEWLGIAVTITERTAYEQPFFGWPNPANSAHVYLPSVYDIVIYTSSGKHVQNFKAVQQFAVSDLKPGIYIVKNQFNQHFKLCVP